MSNMRAIVHRRMVHDEQTFGVAMTALAGIEARGGDRAQPRRAEQSS